jgi:hypothetical protein
MKSKFLKCGILSLAAVAIIGVLIDAADARGRTGSHRIGGYTSHGKGSHYVGGH